MGWTSPGVLGLLLGGVALLVVFGRHRDAGSPSRCSSSACSGSGRSRPAASPGWLVAIARGGLQFMLIIWLQGIWLPLHGYNYSETPLWAGIFLLPLTAGFLVSGPVVGILSDRFGSRGIATAGMAGVRRQLHRPDAAAGQLPLLGLRRCSSPSNGIGSGMFAAPNSSSIMGSVPARHRGAASGMRSTFQNSGTALSIGVFFSLMIAGLASQPAQDADQRPGAAGRPARHRPPDRLAAAGVLAVRRRAGRQPGAAPAGRRPARWPRCPAAAQRILTGREFFPQLISGPFHHGLVVVFAVAAGLAALAALASLLRGGRYVHPELGGTGSSTPAPSTPVTSTPVTSTPVTLPRPQHSSHPRPQHSSHPSQRPPGTTSTHNTHGIISTNGTNGTNGSGNHLTEEEHDGPDHPGPQARPGRDRLAEGDRGHTRGASPR